MSGSINVDHAICQCRRRLSAMSDISQGSVATYIRCAEIFSDIVITNFLLIPMVKEF